VGVPRRVFLSHTGELRDFPPGRSFVDAAEGAVSRAGDAVADMAYFTARDGQPASYCQDRVRECDVYVGLFGLRYGSPVRDRPQVSYTELEFDTATEAGKPRLVFVLDEDAAVPIPPGRLLDTDLSLQERQRAFRARVLDSGVLAAKFATPEQLELLLLQALQGLPDTRARPQAPGGQGRGPGLPAAPDLVGRDAEVAELVGAWLGVPPQPVAVLGPPGIGKSSICLAALHQQEIADRFGVRRWFVRCDGATTAGDMLTGLAGELEVIGDRPDDLAGRVTDALAAGPGVVVLDNFETPWAADPLPVEDLLRAIGAVPGTAVAVSARGTGRPAGLRWHDFAMLTPLPLADARRVFLNITGPGAATDPQLDELLSELDGVPLAVELLGYAAQGQPLDQVAARWRRERTSMLTRMKGDRRELSVPVSIEASVTSPLMTGPARRLLTLLGVLPDGIDSQDLAILLPESGLAAAAVLRQLGLAFDEGSRLRTLAPIREHIAATHPAQAADLDTAISHYAQLAADTGRKVGFSEGAQAAIRLLAETGNITAMLQHAATMQRTSELADAIGGLTEYWGGTGVTQPQLAQQALDAITAHGTPAEQANTLYALAKHAFDRSDYDTAQGRYDQALTLFQQAGNLRGEASTIKGLGDIALYRSDYDTAQGRYDQALALFQQAGGLIGEADCIKGLGDTALNRADYDTAGDRYDQALPLYQQAGHLLGEANTIQRLGETALRRADYDTAGDRYDQALPLYQQAGDLLGEANSIKGLGDVALYRADYDTAGDRYDQALPLYQQAGSLLGEANTIQRLGDIARDRSDHDTARDRYNQALALFQAIPTPYSIGWMYVRLAQLCPSGQERDQRWNAARQAWAGIGRQDLIDANAEEFGG
jgi:tetratricopeptide (TPR) repeat protein